MTTLTPERISVKSSQSLKKSEDNNLETDKIKIEEKEGQLQEDEKVQNLSEKSEIKNSESENLQKNQNCRKISSRRFYGRSVLFLQGSKKSCHSQRNM